AVKDPKLQRAFMRRGYAAFLELRGDLSEVRLKRMRAHITVATVAVYLMRRQQFILMIARYPIIPSAVYVGEFMRLAARNRLIPTFTTVLTNIITTTAPA